MQADQKYYAINQSPLYMLVMRSKLAKLLALTDAELRRLSKHSDKLYRERDLPKKNGDGLRHIENPDYELKKAQYALTKLLGRIAPPDYLFCPVKRRCYVTNAAQHRGHRVVRCLDIKKYFPNTTARRVFWFFHKVMKCDRAIAGTLTGIACYKEHLPTGSPLSPILAFFAHIDMWDAVAAICKRDGLTLTVYMTTSQSRETR
jgi:retron-type reverse transcriptase